ncbi:MAG: glycosyltransferase family 9 protein, partial [Vicinamibacterales bacterium]|nr:glycosyltransferase family 9 protein [Vicinamibacterales bacterium]
LTTPVIRAIRRAEPDAHLTYLVEPSAAPVVTANPHLDDVIVAPLRSGLPRWGGDAALALRLRRARFDVVLDFHGGPRSSLLTWLSGARRRIGYDVSGRGWMYSERVHRPRTHRPRHSVENQWDLLTQFMPGLAPPSVHDDPVEMPDDADARARADDRLRAHGLDPHGPFVVMHVGAGNEFRRWPAQAFAAVVDGLHAQEPDRRMILTTGPAQAPAAEAVRQLAIARGVPGQAVTVVCDLDLAELRSLVGRARLFLGGDSGPAHIASTTAVPMVVLFGPTTPQVWGPWRSRALATETVDVGPLPCRPCRQRHCEPGDFRCLRGLAPDAVLAAAHRALTREAARRTEP